MNKKRQLKIGVREMNLIEKKENEYGKSGEYGGE